jgi:hypothetical protein
MSADVKRMGPDPTGTRRPRRDKAPGDEAACFEPQL